MSQIKIGGKPPGYEAFHCAANGNGKSSPVDILHLIDHLNGVYEPPVEIRQCDINRSGVCGPADILRLIDLLNGANTSRPWLGVSLPPRP
jgi:hypothetical protein